MDDDLTFGQWLKRRRRGLGLTQRTLGERAGYAAETIRKVEADELRPSLPLLARLAEALQIQPADLEPFFRFGRDESSGQASALPSLSVPFPEGLRTWPAGQLPVALTPFVGRERELAQLDGLLADRAVRLITLIGPGGIGKSRLALQAAHASLALFKHGAYLVPVAPVSAPVLLPSAIADALGFTFNGNVHPHEQLVNYLREKQVLLVLDNFEHLVNEAPYLAEVLQQAPQVVLLVTSRERLRLQAEWHLEVSGLEVPALTATLAEIERSSAVQLFTTTARRAGAELGQSLATLAGVARICRLVEGLPLALELAAAWTDHQSPEQIGQAIEQDLDFLVSSMRDRPERHRSLRATFDASWRQLSEAEQAAFCQLCVFRGGFAPEAAERVAAAPLRVLAALADKSFIRREQSGRYQIHELLRQFGSAKLAQAVTSESRHIAERHSAFFVDFLQQRDHRLKGPEQLQALAEIRVEFDNIWMAWRWAVSHGAASEAAEAAHALWSYFEITGDWSLATTLFQWASETTASTGGDRLHQIAQAKFQVYYGWFCHRMGRYLEARQAAIAGVERLKALDAHDDTTFFVHVAATVTWLMGDYAEARRLVETESATVHARRDQWFEAAILAFRSMLAMSVGDHEKAAVTGQQVVAMFREVGDPRMLSQALSFHGAQLNALGDHAAAVEHLRESLAISRGVGDRWSSATCLLHLGRVYYSLGDYEAAKALQVESADLYGELGDRAQLATSLCGLATTLAALGESVPAAARFLQALELAQLARATPVLLDALVGLGSLWKSTASPQLARVAEILSLVNDHPASDQEARFAARQLLAELQNEAGAADLSRATPRDLDAVVDEVLRLSR